jgi:alpha/beta superfamily hydrolase
MEEYQIDIKSIDDNDILKINFLGCNDAQVNGISFKSYYYNFNNMSTIDALKTTAANTYVITASEDNIVPLTHEKVKISAELNENVKLYTIDGADHFFRDFYFDDLFEIILDEIEQ